MDALRKAEAERRRAGGKPEQDATGAHADDSVAGRIPGGDDTHGAPAADVTAAGAPAPQQAGAGERTTSLTGELSLAPLADDSGPAVAADAGVTSGEGVAPAEPGVDTTVESVRGSATGTISGAGGLDEESTVPSARAIRSSLEEYFEGSQSLETSRLGMATVPAGEGPAVDTGLATPVSAQTVFAAQRAPGAARAANLVIGAAVFVTVVLAAGGAWYMLQTPEPRATPSPRVARGVERPLIEPFVVPEVIPPQAAPVVPDASEPLPTVVQATAAPAGEAQAAETAAASAGPADTAALPAGTAPPAPPADSAPLTASAAPAPAPAPAVASPAASAAPLTVAPAEIRISRGRGRPQAHSRVSAAYAALRAGDPGGARRAYRDALAADPDNRDALLGLAALAVHAGDLAAAYDTYRRVLRLHPRDAVASAALFSLQGYTGPGVNESRLKLMLDHDPQAAFLHFVLGNSYARQQRWAEAERAYFEAHALQGDNPEFAYNLAVSLDHLGQRAAARDYYRRALDMAAGQGAAFAAAAARERLRALDAAAGP